MLDSLFFRKLCEESIKYAREILPNLGAVNAHLDSVADPRVKDLLEFRSKVKTEMVSVYNAYYAIYTSLFKRDFANKQLCPSGPPPILVTVIDIYKLMPHFCYMICTLICALERTPQGAGCGEGAMTSYAYLGKRIFPHLYIRQSSSKIRSLDLVAIMENQHSNVNHAVILINSEFRTSLDSEPKLINSLNVFGRDCIVIDPLSRENFYVQQHPQESIFANSRSGKPIYAKTLISSAWLFEKIEGFSAPIKAYVFSVYMHFLQVRVREDLERYNHWQYQDRIVAQTESTSLARIKQLTNAQFIGRVQTSVPYPVSAGKIDRRDRNLILDALCYVKLDTPACNRLLQRLCELWIPFNFKFRDGKVYVVIEGINVADQDGGVKDTILRGHL